MKNHILKLISVVTSVFISCSGLSVLGADNENFITNLDNLAPVNGNWSVESNGLHSWGNGDIFAVSETVSKDFVYEAEVHFNTLKGAASLMFRANSVSETYIANIDLSDSTARIFTFGANAGDISDRYKLEKKNDYKMKIIAAGDNIQYYVDDVLAASVTNSEYTEGKLGLLTWEGDVVYQNVKYTPLSDSDIPKLESLESNQIDLDFSKERRNYYLRAGYDCETVSFTPRSNSDISDIYVSAFSGSTEILKKKKIASGENTGNIPLASGKETVLTFEVSKEITQSYEVRLYRPQALKGDINGDGALGEDDLNLMTGYIFGNTAAGEYESKAADMNSDGEINVSDVVKLRYAIQNESRSKKITYEDMAARLTGLKELSYKSSGEKSGELSSYDKSSRYDESADSYKDWYANDDWGKDIPKDSDGGYLLADLKGAGVITRIWSAEPKSGHIKIFIDGSSQPAVDMPFKDIFGKAPGPFSIETLCYSASRGMNCYVPITYNTSCKIKVYDDWGRYYQINYTSFDDDTYVEPFTYPLGEKQQKALNQAAETLSSSYKNEGDNVYKKTVTIPAGGSEEILNQQGAGAVTGINIKIENLPDQEGADWKALSDMAVSAYWDKSENPAVWTTLGGFFGSITGLNEYNALPLGVRSDKTMYCNWYMPFGDGAKIVIANDGETDYSITYEIRTEKLENADDLLRFHCKWVRASDPEKTDRWPDSSFLTAQGQGRYVGTSLHIYKEIGTSDPAYGSDWWWGEGDEKFFVDGEKFPSWFGTGTEDYFGYAWGSWQPFDHAYHSQPFTNGGMFGIGNRLNNRFHIIDNVPFSESFDGYFEKYHRDGYSNWVFTNYWYLDKDGTDPYGPVPLEERTCYYETPYPEASDFYEGEELKIVESTGMLKAETQDMTPFGSTWSNNSQFIFKASGAGDYVKFLIKVPEDGVYNFKAKFTKAGDFGTVQHYIDDAEIGSQIDLFNSGVILSDEIVLGQTELSAGIHEFKVQLKGKNNASSGYFYGLDYLKVENVSGV